MRTKSVCRRKGRQLDPDLEQQIQRPTAYGQLLSGDTVIVSKKNEGQGDDRTALHVRDHYSGELAEYAAKRRTFANNVKAFKHFGGSMPTEQWHVSVMMRQK